MSSQQTDQQLSAGQMVADPTTPYAKPELTTRRDARIIVACASGGRSLLATETLKKMGYTNVVSMAGGFIEWSKQDLPVE